MSKVNKEAIILYFIVLIASCYVDKVFNTKLNFIIIEIFSILVALFYKSKTTQPNGK